MVAISRYWDPLGSGTIVSTLIVLISATNSDSTSEGDKGSTTSTTSLSGDTDEVCKVLVMVMNLKDKTIN